MLFRRPFLGGLPGALRPLACAVSLLLAAPLVQAAGSFSGLYVLRSEEHTSELQSH